jgi:SsrA-binding protein
MRIFNKKARVDFIIIEKFEAGITLLGAEIKSIRQGRVSLNEAYARIKEGQVYLTNCYIGSWMGSERQVDLKRDRRLLLHKRQIEHLLGKTSGSNLTIVPISIYIKNNLAKVEIALARSKRKFERRDELRKKALERDVERELRQKE